MFNAPGLIAWNSNMIISFQDLPPNINLRRYTEEEAKQAVAEADAAGAESELARQAAAAAAVAAAGAAAAAAAAADKAKVERSSMDNKSLR